jgi:hypothetical protein
MVTQRWRHSDGGTAMAAESETQCDETDERDTRRREEKCIVREVPATRSTRKTENRQQRQGHW